jgi:hypothetical protein
VRVFDNHCVVCGKEQLAIDDLPHCDGCEPTQAMRDAQAKWVAQYRCPFPNVSDEQRWKWTDTERLSLAYFRKDEHGTQLSMSIMWADHRWRAGLEFESHLEAAMSGNFNDGDDPKMLCEKAAHDLWAILIDRQLTLEGK